MNLVRIRGTATVLRALGDVEGLLLEPETAVPHGDGYRVSAHASDEAITAIRARGAEVDVLMNNEQFEEHFAKVQAQVQRDPSEDGG